MANNSLMPLVVSDSHRVQRFHLFDCRRATFLIYVMAFLIGPGAAIVKGQNGYYNTIGVPTFSTMVPV